MGKHVIRIILAIFVTGLSAVLPIVIQRSTLQSILFDIQSHDDCYQIYDYTQSLNQPTRPCYRNDSIVIVDIHNCDRRALLNIMNVVVASCPRVIGLDVCFADSVTPQVDTALQVMLSMWHDDLVLPSAISEIRIHDSVSFVRRYIHNEHYFGDLEAECGAPANFYRENHVIRRFRSYFPINNDLIPSFATQIAIKASPEVEPIVLKRYNSESELEYIPFNNIKFLQISGDSINLLYGQNDTFVILDCLLDKIVLLGDLSDPKDMYSIAGGDKPKMSGVEIHAHILDTILGNHYISITASAWAWVLACILCFILNICHSIIDDFGDRKHQNHIANLISRFVQITLMLLIVFIAWHSLRADWVVNMTPSVLMLGTESLSYDIVYGLFYGTCCKLYKYINHKR